MPDVYTPLYEGTISPTPIRDPVTNKLLSGPFIVEMDSDPGRLSRECMRILFLEDMAKNNGVHILLSLPNGMAYTAEMDHCSSKRLSLCAVLVHSILL